MIASCTERIAPKHFVTERVEAERFASLDEHLQRTARVRPVRRADADLAFDALNELIEALLSGRRTWWSGHDQTGNAGDEHDRCALSAAEHDGSPWSREPRMQSSNQAMVHCGKMFPTKARLLLTNA
jgi:hypothetical protein